MPQGMRGACGARRARLPAASSSASRCRGRSRAPAAVGQDLLFPNKPHSAPPARRDICPCSQCLARPVCRGCPSPAPGTGSSRACSCPAWAWRGPSHSDVTLSPVGEPRGRPRPGTCPGPAEHLCGVWAGLMCQSLGTHWLWWHVPCPGPPPCRWGRGGPVEAGGGSPGG